MEGFIERQMHLLIESFLFHFFYHSVVLTIKPYRSRTMHTIRILYNHIAIQRIYGPFARTFENYLMDPIPDPSKKCRKWKRPFTFQTISSTFHFGGPLREVVLIEGCHCIILYPKIFPFSMYAHNSISNSSKIQGYVNIYSHLMHPSSCHPWPAQWISRTAP